MVNKTINDKQCMIVWLVDDLKILHAEPDMVTEIINMLQQEFGKQVPLTIKHGKKHDYLGLTLDFSTGGKVVI